MNQRPIILVGTHRSGTTWLGEVFSQHPRLAYWVEPRHVWTFGNSYTPDDVLTEQHAHPRIVRHIRETFETFVKADGRDRLCEKTPSNCLRLRFIRAVYPDARILLVVRDGRSVLRSTDEIMASGVPMSRIIARAKETPLTEWPAYAGQTAATVFRKLTGRKLKYWGPRPPGWKNWVRHDHPDVVMAKQWAGTIGHALDDAQHLTSTGLGVFQFRYEEVMADPARVMADVCRYAELEQPEPVIEYAVRTADASRANKWRAELDDALLAQVRPFMEPTLSRLGYVW